MWKLRKGQPPFEVVDGLMAGHIFVPGRTYEVIPTDDRHRFEKIKKTKKAAQVKGGGKNA